MKKYFLFLSIFLWSAYLKCQTPAQDTINLDTINPEYILNNLLYYAEDTSQLSFLKGLNFDRANVQALFNIEEAMNCSRFFSDQIEFLGSDQINQEIMALINIDGSEKFIESILESDLENNNLQRLKSGPSKYDSRIEITELNPLIGWELAILNKSESIGIIVEKEFVSQLSDNYFHLEINTKLQHKYGLCKGEPFIDQPSVGVGTAFLIDTNIVVTASHVLERPLEDYYVILGFELINKNGNVRPLFPRDKVFSLEKRIIDDQNEYDVSVLQLNRSVKTTIPKIADDYDYREGSVIYSIGHPLGIPKKVSLNASIISEDASLPYFYTSLDAFQGNSGSPVFDFETHTIIGILVSGELDFESRGGCLVSKICKPPFCKGEKIIKASVLKRLLELDSY